MNTYLTKHFSMKLQTQRGLFVRFFQSLKLSTLGMLTLLGVVALGLVACGGGGGSSGGGGGGDQMLLTPSGDNWNLVIATRISQATQPAAQSESGGQGGLRAQSAGGFTPTAITPGQTFTLEVDVYNDGEDASPEVTLTFYRSTDSTIDTADDIAGVIAIPSLEANGDTDDIVTHNLELPPPSDSTKDYVYGTCIINDETPSDNCAASEVASDGSVIDDVTVAIQWDWSVPSVNVTWSVASHVLSDDVIQGWPITLRAEVANAATGFTAPRSAITFYRSTDATIDTSDTAIGHFTVPALSVGEDADGSITSTAPTTPGDYYFGACIPSDSSESNEGNNCMASAAVTVIDGGWNFWSRARLVRAYGDDVKTVTYKPGVSFDLFALVGNWGGGGAYAATPATTLTYYRATDAAFSARSYKGVDPSVDDVVGTSEVPSLELEEDYRTFIQIAAEASGTYHYAMCVPHEGNLGGRCSLDRFTSSGARGYVTVIVDPAGTDGDTLGGRLTGFHLGPTTSLNPGFTVYTMSIAANTQFTLYASSSNHIRATDPSPATTVTFFRSTDTIILDDGSDTSLGGDVVPTLYPGQGVDHSLIVTTPSTPGTYNYGACVPGTIGGKTNEEGVTRCTPQAYSDGDPGYATVIVPDPSASSSGWYFWSRARFAASGDAIQTKTYKPGVTFDLFSLVGNGSGVSVASPAIAVTYYRATKAAFDGRAEKVIDPSVDTVVGTSDVPVLQPGEDIRGFVQAITPTANGTYHYATCVPHTGNLGGQCARGDIDHPLRDSDYVTVIVAASGADGDTSGGKVAGWHLSAGTALDEGFTAHMRTIAANTQFTFYLASCNWIRAAEDSPAATVTALRSTNATISDDGSDTTVGTAMVRGLFPGVCATHTFTPTTPATAGVYHYGACAPATVGSVNNAEAGRCTPATYSDGDPGYVTVTVPAAGTSQGACTSGTVYTPGQFCTLAYDSKNYTFEVFSVSPFASVAEGGTLNYGANFANPAVGYIAELYWNVPNVASVPFLPIVAYESSDTNYKVELGAACVSGHAYTPWEWCTYTYNSKEYFFTVDAPDSYYRGVADAGGDTDGGNQGACVRDAGWAAAGDSDNVDICNGEGSLSPYGVSITENANGSFTLTLL